MRDLELHLHFGLRAECDIKKVSKNVSLFSSGSFPNVGGYRYSGALDLRSEPESFVSREALADFIDLLDQIHGSLPHHEITERTAFQHGVLQCRSRSHSSFLGMLRKARLDVANTATFRLGQVRSFCQLH